MFDWNDQEIAEIVWGGPGDSDDHIVPYPEGREGISSFHLGDCNKKQRVWEDNAVAKTEENNQLEAKNDVSGVKLVTSDYGADEELAASGLDLDTWSNLPPANVDANARNSMGTEASNEFTSMTNFNVQKGEPELFGNEHGDTDSDSFLDYSWANIGNFDDLDRIFRNDESMLERENIGNANELWTSSPIAEMISNSPTRSFSMLSSSPSSDLRALGSAAERYKVKLELPYQDQPVNPVSERRHDFSYSNLSGPPSKDKAVEVLNQAEDSTETTAETASLHSQHFTANRGGQNPATDKVTKQKKFSKSRKKAEEVNDGKFSKSVSSTWSHGVNPFQQYPNSRMPVSALQTFPSSVYNGPESLSYLRASNPYTHMGYGYPVHQFSLMPQLPSTGSDMDAVLNNYKLSPYSTKQSNTPQMSTDVQRRMPYMTPQEKIEKLRRRQQMQALLAIRQQQQKLGQQISGLDQKGSKDKQGQDAVLSNIEVDENAANIHLQSSLELNFSVDEKDGSKTSMLLDEYTLAETIFLQLEDAISKLDNKTRLCIRDSLFRLAKSAMQRHGVSDTSSTNESSRDENDFYGNEETNSHERSSKSSDAETNTNPIDRTVAHLLFHRSADPSAGPPVNDGGLESPISGSSEWYHFQLKAESAEPVAECLSENLTDKQSMYKYVSQSAPPQFSAADHHQEISSQAMPKT